MDTQVLSVQGRNTKSGTTIYDVALGDGETYVTFDAGLAARAQALMGQVVTADVNVKPKPGTNFVNRYLNDIGAQGTIQVAQQQSAPVPMASNLPPVPIVQQQGTSGGSGWTPEKEKRVTILSCLGSAAQLFQGAGPEAAPDVINVAKLFFAEAFGTTESVAAEPPENAVEENAAEAETPQEEATLPWR